MPAELAERIYEAENLARSHLGIPSLLLEQDAMALTPFGEYFLRTHGLFDKEYGKREQRAGNTAIATDVGFLASIDDRLEQVFLPAGVSSPAEYAGHVAQALFKDPASRSYLDALLGKGLARQCQERIEAAEVIPHTGVVVPLSRLGNTAPAYLETVHMRQVPQDEIQAEFNRYRGAHFPGTNMRNILYAGHAKDNRPDSHEAEHRISHDPE
ncbi:MAG: hypothetical protein HC945_01255 [Nitrosarchaeum sp.]|nr:hypothetical protein [Nitrosarchaeum sp.]